MSADLFPLPHWLAALLLIIALVLLMLLVMATVAVIRRLGAAIPVRQQRAGGTTGAPADTQTTVRLSDALRRTAERLMVLTGSQRGFDAIPLLAAVGVGSDDIRHLVADLGVGSGDLSQALQELFLGDCRISICPSGAIISFVDGLLNSSRLEARWTALIDELQKFREERPPFDGLVIVLKCDQLFGPTRLGDEDLAVLGERLYRLIWTAQRNAGWRVPIYLVLNGCEVLTGFTATAATLNQLPSRLRTQLQGAPFGWAVPYALASAFERGWVREGIDALITRLSVLQSRLLVQPRSTETTEEERLQAAEQLLLFPRAVAALAEPLSIMLTPMLRPSAYHEAFMFRGFYLTGRDASAATALETFAAPLFTNRIFPEHVLAQPAEGATSQRYRHIQMAKIALAVLVLFAWVGVVQVLRRNEAVSTVLPLVQEIDSFARANELVKTQFPLTSNEHISRSEEQQLMGPSQLLLQAMSEVSVNRLTTVWAPLSYLTDADGAVVEALQAAYRFVVLPEVRGRLSHEILDRLQDYPPPDASLTSIERLQRTTEWLTEYADQLRSYRELTSDHSPGIQRLKSLLEYALSFQLSDRFISNYQLYVDALHGARPPALPMAEIRKKVGMILDARFNLALDAAYLNSPIAAAVKAVVANAGVPAVPTPVISQIERLRLLDKALHQVQEQTPLSKNAWLVTAGENAPSITAALDEIKSLSLSTVNLAPVDSILPVELGHRAIDSATRTRDFLLAHRVFDNVPVLSQSEGQVQLSPPLVAAMAALDKFLEQPLATIKVPALNAAPGVANAALFWDSQDLQSLQQSTESYVVFAAADLPNSLPYGFRLQMWAAAGQQLDQLVAAAISRARQAGASRPAVSYGGAAALNDEIASFANAVPILINLQTALRAADRTNLSQRLAQLLSAQALQLLQQLNALLTIEDPYQLTDQALTFWSGTPPLAAAAFGVATLPDLIATLPARRGFVAMLARDYAAPLVGYLQQTNMLSSPGALELAKRWQGILRTLALYDNGNTANSLTRLEQFISVDMDHITLTNCSQFAAAAGSGSDWFAQQLGNLRTVVVRRCNSAAHVNFVRQYDNLATTFNRELAGRFPFGPPTAPDAYVGDVKLFYDRFGPELASMQKQVAGVRTYARAGAASFIGRLQAVRTALAPLLSNPVPDAPLTYDVAVDFRTNMDNDSGANQVAEATVRFGERELSSFATTKSLAWSNGQSAQLLLRWAENAPTIPATVQQPPVQVRGLVASYDYGGSWALLRMVAAQRPSPAVIDQLWDRRPETLGFSVMLKPNPKAASGGNRYLAQAHLFMRFALTAIIHTPGQPDKRQAVALPVFPRAAPEPYRTVATSP